MPVHEDIVGIAGGPNGPIAFQRNKAVAALKSGQQVTAGGVSLVLDAGGLRAADADLVSHQAYWFAWSQFHPNTALWVGAVDQ